MADDKDKQEEFDVLEVGADGKPLVAPPNGADTQAGGQGADTAAGATGNEYMGDEDEDADERIALNDEERAARKEERRLKNERRKEANRRRELEMIDLKRRNDELERRLQGVEQGQTRINVTVLNERISVAEQQFRQAEELLTRAMVNAAKEPQKVTEALRLRDEARDAYARLSHVKNRYEAETGGRGNGAERPGAERTAERAPEIPPEVRRRVDAFAAKHDWYDIRGGNTDSKIVQALDQAVAEEGYDPATPEYWSELEKRAARQLPHRFPAAGNGQAGTRKAPPMAGGGGSAASGGGNGKTVVRVTPERKKAMMEAGMWDDPVKRNKMLKRYAEHDRQSGGGAAA